jgi:hypothetical protein
LTLEEKGMAYTIKTSKLGQFAGSGYKNIVDRVLRGIVCTSKWFVYIQRLLFVAIGKVSA